MDTWEWYNKYSQELRDAGQEYIPQLIDDFQKVFCICKWKSAIHYYRK